MWLDTRTVRKILLTAVVAAVASTPATAKAFACWETEQHNGLFCNDGSNIQVCDYEGQCFVSCGKGWVEADC
ncbi:MAG: hypothetical protein AMXMBFR53_02360 [Gemmatimonadota bacterium]